MAKLTRIESPKEDDPLFKNGPQVSVPIARPRGADILPGRSNPKPVPLDSLRGVMVRRGTVEADLIKRLEHGGFSLKPKSKP